MPQVVIGEIETRHFSFMFVAESEEKVKEEARNAWERHCNVYDAEPDYIEELIEGGDLHITEVDSLPVSFRDGEVI